MQRTQIEWVVCHRKPERSFFWKGQQFPLCARCTGIQVGYLSLPIFSFGWVVWPWWMVVVMLLPTVVDGYTQAYFDRESNNWLRLATGICAGASLMQFAAFTGQWIGKSLLELF
jgi:uncharacterized membrane protein